MIARVADGRLTTVARTVIATSSSEAAPAATELRSWKTYVPTRYSVTVGRRSPLRHIAGVPPAETDRTSSPAASAPATAAASHSTEPGSDGYVMKPSNRKPSVRAIEPASVTAASGEA